MCLLRTIRERPRGYFQPFVKSLSFSDSVMLPMAKPLLAELSRSIITFLILRRRDYPDNFLEYIRSPYIRRLSMVYKSVPEATAYSWDSPYEIPGAIFNTLTHL